MSNESLYNVYRPQTFTDLVGQPDLTAIGPSIADGTFSHGYLLYGQHGCGKTSTARIIAASLNCTNRHENGDPCLECDSCRMVLSKNHPDIIEFNASMTNTRADVDRLLSTIYNPPLYGDYKVYIIDEVHRLSNEAESLLLKPLEEPPARTVFVLATTDIHKVRKTIQSRLVKIRVSPLSPACAEQFVKSIITVGREDFPSGYWDITDTDIRSLVDDIGGSPRDLLSALHAKVFHGHTDEVDSARSFAEQLIPLIMEGSEYEIMSLFLTEGYSANHEETIESVARLLTEKCVASQVRPSGLSSALWDGLKRVSGDGHVSPLAAMSFVAHLSTLFQGE